MHRFLSQKLLQWKERPTRHPLILRGARQVGKTYLVRELAQSSFAHFIEVNFEADATLSSFFASKDPSVICELLSAKYSVPVIDGQTLLFLDELQAAPPFVLESLRYFYEKRPGLHVIAAGSLLEFLLEQSNPEPARHFPMPVGRLEYMYVPPLQFEEFLLAAGQSGLVDWLGGYQVGTVEPEGLHRELSLWLRRYLAIGGMPAVAQAYFGGDITAAQREQQLLLATYHDDFPKYGRHASPALLQKVFLAIPAMLGHKLVFSHIDTCVKARDLSEAFNRLCQARVVAKIRHTPANGIPIGFGANGTTFKPLFLDVGLACRALGLSLADFVMEDTALLENRGEICEQFIGQHLLYAGEEYEEPSAYYWQREARGASAEVDYIVQTGNEIVPVEVKSGRTGSLKGLHLFLNEKHRSFAVRFNADLPSLLEDACLKDTAGRECRFTLLSLPLYLVGQLPRLLRERAYWRKTQ
ncbi:MAG: ATP-binding protein [Victivallales bacterium]|nr:ATP-binding protein [Victivallales bacterium]